MIEATYVSFVPKKKSDKLRQNPDGGRHWTAALA
jgi:hypothetical protein